MPHQRSAIYEPLLAEEVALAASEEESHHDVNVPPRYSLRPRLCSREMLTRLCALFGVVIFAGGVFYAGRLSASSSLGPSWTGTLSWTGAPTSRDLECIPFLPNLHATLPPAANDIILRRAGEQLRSEVNSRFKTTGLDALSLAVFTSAENVLESHWGVLRANGSAERAISPLVNAHSQYRVASVSKLLISYEGWILAQRGIISWNDPVSKYLPSYESNDYSFSDNTSWHPRTTLHDLAAHLSGLGRDWPPGEHLSRFPHDLKGSGPPPANGLPFSHEDAVLAAVRAHALVHPPGWRPSYSNTGLGILGMALLAADRSTRGTKDSGPETIAELLHRDVFGPLGMTDSHFLATNENRGNLVVPSVSPEYTDLDFGDAMNPSGGAFASLHDLALLTRSLLHPAVHPANLNAPGVLDPDSVARFLRPDHSFEEDDWSEAGAPWEIVKHLDSHGRRRRVYWKLGNLPGTHAAVAIHPGSGYGVVALLSGAYSDAAAVAYLAFDTFQPAFDALAVSLANELYAGLWASSESSPPALTRAMLRSPASGEVRTNVSMALISVREGTLWMDELVLNGEEVLSRLFKAPEGAGLPLQGTGRHDELRVDPGRPSMRGRVHTGCLAHWASLDGWGMRHGASHNLIYFTGKGTNRSMHLPAAGVTMTRVGDR